MFAITFQGTPLTLSDKLIETNKNLPEIELFNNDLTTSKITDTKGVKIIATVPSLDTPVCDTEIRKFNEKASQLENVSIFAVSADLPFAQARWCGAASIDKVKTLSDYKDMTFAKALGLYINELRLFARAILVVNSENKITYIELVKEMTDEPDYEKALQAAKNTK